MRHGELPPGVERQRTTPEFDAATGWLVTRGARFLSYRVLFGASEIVLLLIAGSLLGAGIDRMIGMDWLPPLLDPAKPVFKANNTSHFCFTCFSSPSRGEVITRTARLPGLLIQPLPPTGGRAFFSK